ncbi:MAG: extracellular solute-binding protein, partial [Candidatus Wallbacteria bacterium]|nr:extracellular solute-binding protein [Candidatus Wallbacteria bacterium]
YRSVLAIKLAEDFYGEPGFAAQMLKKDLRYIRPKETDLLALLETGELDYIFLYRSVAMQHGLKYVVLPDEINLKRAELAATYAGVSLEITGSEPGTMMTVKGEPMVYGVTIPKKAPNYTAAVAFVDMLLGRIGAEIMERNGQPSLVPAPTDTFQHIPESLRGYARPITQ